jgi:hypothetical protein
VTTNAVPVTNGSFTVQLDFGLAPFTGAARWLEIGVKSNGLPAFDILTPRQTVAPTPYAIHSHTAGAVTDNAITSAGIASGQVVKSLNGLKDAVALTAGANVTLTTNANALQIAATTGVLTLPYIATVSTNNQAAVELYNSHPGGAGIYGSGTLYGVQGASTFGYGTYGTAHGASGYGVHGLHVPTGNYGSLGLQGMGVYGQFTPNGNYGLLGHSVNGVDGVAANSASVGARGIHIPTGNYGTLGISFAGVYGNNPNSATVGALAHANGGVLGMGGEGTTGYLGHKSGAGWPAVGVYGDATGTNVPGWFYRPDDGVMIGFQRLGIQVGDITVAGPTVSYNAFTGSHYGKTDEVIGRGELVTLIGTNSYSSTNLDSEIIYGISRSTQPNDARCLGAYLSVQAPSKPTTDRNPHLVMAVGNGDMWVTPGANGDIAPGDYLISSAVPGCAMKDDPEKFPVGYVCARAAEYVNWSEVSPDADGIKRRKISVLFESFERHAAAPALAAAVRTLQAESKALKVELKTMSELGGRLVRLEAQLAMPATLRQAKLDKLEGGNQ